MRRGRPRHNPLSVTARLERCSSALSTSIGPRKHHHTYGTTANMVDRPAYQSDGDGAYRNAPDSPTSHASADGENGTTNARSWVCEHCHRSFSREEHLQRHVRRHLGLRPFICLICSNGFSRRSFRSQCPENIISLSVCTDLECRDTLRRHLNTHGLTAAQILALSKSPHGSACTNCAISKQRCDRLSPCGRCRQRNLRCTVPVGHSIGQPAPPTNPAGELWATPQDRVHPAKSSDQNTHAAQSPDQNRQHWGLRNRVGAAVFGAVEFSTSASENDTHDGFENRARQVSQPSADVGAAPGPTDDVAPDVFFSGFSGSEPEAVNQASVQSSLMDAWFYPFASWDSDPRSLEPDGWDGTVISWTGAGSLGSPTLKPLGQCPVPAYEDIPTLQQAGTVDQAGAIGAEPLAADSTLMQPDNTPYIGTDEQPQSKAASQTCMPSATKSPEPHPSPQLLPSDFDVIVAEDFGHVPRVSSDVHERISQFFYFQHGKSSRGVDHPIFPSIDALNTFIQLYFEYFHPQVPILHVATFNPGLDDWMLVVAVAAIGCQHSAISNQDSFAVALRELLHQAILRKVSFPAYIS